MEYKKLHKWNVPPDKAVEIQKKLQKKITISSLNDINYLLACDVSYSQKLKKIFPVGLIFKYPSLELIKKYYNIIPYEKINLYPYIPGLLSFRESPILLNVLLEIKEEVDLLLFDAHGLMHPRFMGLATHLGILLNLPTIGCAKNPLLKHKKKPQNKFMSYETIVYKNRKVGIVLRSKPDTNPIYASPGHKTDIHSSLKIIPNCITKYKIPIPLRKAHLFSTKLKNMQSNS